MKADEARKEALRVAEKKKETDKRTKEKRVENFINIILNEKIPYAVSKGEFSCSFIIYDKRFFKESYIRHGAFSSDEKYTILTRLQENGYNIKNAYKTKHFWEIEVSW